MMRIRRTNRGETLVETIVAFSILMILLTMVMTVIRGAIALNNRAAERLAELAEDCERLEMAGAAPSVTSGHRLTLTYQAEGSTPVANSGALQCVEDLDVFDGEILMSFRLAGDDGSD